MTLGLDHLQLAMPAGEEEAARAFWCGILGLAELEKPEALKARGGLWFELAGAELHLGVETPFAPAKKAHPGLTTPDAEQTAQALQAAGHPVAWDESIPDRKRFFSEDPFGNRLEFLEP
ncbi:VOC family protein [Vannielia litorea]|uniref:VOC family protein n=1 Tax=Vannielia litorea TaxID=1217970 RepID=UPI001BCE4F02|nr:VOC family protein [Vannielia litorea]MBS8225667.1 glyoxalase [Vannielia litorea]